MPRNPQLNRPYMLQTATLNSTGAFVEGWAETCDVLTLFSMAQANPTTVQNLSSLVGITSMADIFFGWNVDLFENTNYVTEDASLGQGLFFSLATVMSQAPPTWQQYTLKPFADALYDTVARTGAWPTPTELGDVLDLSVTNSQGQVQKIDGLLPSQKFGQAPGFMTVPAPDLATEAACYPGPLFTQGVPFSFVCFSWQYVQNNGPGTSTYVGLNLPLTLSVQNAARTVVIGPVAYTYAQFIAGSDQLAPGAYNLLIQYQDQASGNSKTFTMPFGVMPTALPNPNTFPAYPLYVVTENTAGNPVDGNITVTGYVTTKLGPGFYSVAAPTGSDVVVNNQHFSKTALPRFVTVSAQ